MSIQPNPLRRVLRIPNHRLGKWILHRANRKRSGKFLFQIQPLIQRHGRRLFRGAAHEGHDHGDDGHQPEPNPECQRGNAQVKQPLDDDQQ